MSTNGTRVTVLMPCYNSMPYLTEAIESILNQSYKKFILLIIYDKSDDGSYECALDYAKKDERIKVVKNKYGKGVMNARNTGLELVDTEFAAIMDADDIAPVYRLEMEINYLDEHKEIGAVAGLARIIDDNGNRNLIFGSSSLNPNRIRCEMIFNDPIPNGSTLIRNSEIKKNHLYYRDVEIEDYQFWCDLVLVTRMVILPYIMLLYRVTDTNLTNTIDKRVGHNERMKRLYNIHDFMFEKHNLRIGTFQKKHLYKILCEYKGPVPKWDKIVNYFTYGALIKQSKDMELSCEFLEVCKKNRRINLLEKIKMMIV